MDAQIANLIVERDEARAIAERLLRDREDLLTRVIELEQSMSSLREELQASRWGEARAATSSTHSDLMAAPEAVDSVPGPP